MLLAECKQEWIHLFEKLREEFLKSLKGIKIDIEPIGSTSIPNLPSQQIIDIDIIYNNYEFELIKKRNESIG